MSFSGVVNAQGGPGGPGNQAGGPGGPQDTQLWDPLNCQNNQGGNNQTCLQKFLMGILSVVIRIGTIVIVLMLVYIGFLFATSSVNPQNKDKARTALVWTLVGALILLGAQAIAMGIEATVNAISNGANTNP